MESVLNLDGKKILTRTLLAGQRFHQPMRPKQRDGEAMPQIVQKVTSRCIGDHEVVLGLSVEHQENIPVLKAKKGTT